jgi:hypothetical protein
MFLFEAANSRVGHEALGMAPTAFDLLVATEQREGLQVVVERGLLEPPNVELPAQMLLVTRAATRLVERGMEPLSTIDPVPQGRMAGEAKRRRNPGLPELVARRARSDSLQVGVGFGELSRREDL